MKKFTLEFINENMEANFRHAKLINVQKPIYTCLVFSALFYSLFGAIQTSILENVEQAKLTIFISSALLIQCVITLKYPQSIWINLIVSVYLSLLTQLDIATASTTYDYYLYGANIQLWQACVFTLCEFKHSLHLIICATVMKLAIPLYYNTSDYREVFGSIACAIVFLVMNYLNNKMARSQYLLTKKDLKWQQYMPSIIQKPYFIVEYNDAQRCFTSIEQQLFNWFDFQYSYDYTLRLFLRKTQIENVTLEQYLFRYIYSHPEESTLEAICEKKRITIKLYDLNIKNNQYLLIINPPKTVQENIIHQQNMLQYTQFIKIQTKLAKLPFNLMVKVRSKIMNNLFLSSSVLCNTQIAKINFTRLISKLSSMYKLGYQINVEVISDRDIYLNTFRAQLFGFLNYLFLLFQHQYSKQLQNIKLILEKSDPDAVYMKICLLNAEIFYYEYQQCPMLKSLEPSLLYSPISKDLELKFVCDMQQSFKNILN